MNENHADAIDKLLAHYDDPYRCARKQESGSPLAATAFMHLVSDRKLLSMIAAGSVESDDFVYIYSLPTLDETTLDALCAEVLQDGLSRIDPNPDHNFSLLSAFFLCDSITPGAAAKLKKTKYHKKFVKPECGTVDLRLAAIEVGGKTHAANPLGKALLQIYRAAMHA